MKQSVSIVETKCFLQENIFETLFVQNFYVKIIRKILQFMNSDQVNFCNYS